MPDLRLAFVIQAVDAATAPLRRLHQNVTASARSIAKAFKPAGEMLERFSQSYEGLALAVGGGVELKEVIGDEDLFNRLRLQYALTGKAADELKEKMLLGASAAGASVDEVRQAVLGFAQGGGDLAGFAEEAGLAAKAIRLLGGQGADVGAALASLQKDLRIDGPEALTRSLATLYEQSRRMPGGFGEMVKGLADTAKLYSDLGHTGPAAAHQIGAVFSAMAKGIGSADRARSDLQQLLEMLRNPYVTAKPLMALGVNLFGADGKTTLPIAAILKQLVGKYRSDPFITRLLLPQNLVQELDRLSRDAGALDRALKVTGDPAKFLRDAAAASNSLSAQLKVLRGQFEIFADDHFSGAIRGLTEVLRRFGAVVSTVLTALAGMLVVTKLFQWGKAFVGVISAVVEALSAVPELLAAIFAPAVLVIGGIVAAVAGAAYLIYEH